MAPPKPISPLTADLDAATFSIVNVGQLEAANVKVGTPDGSFGVYLLDDGTGSLLAVIAGTGDPSTGFIGPVTPGSLYVRHVDDDHGEVWAKTGGANTAWTKIAG